MYIYLISNIYVQSVAGLWLEACRLKLDPLEYQIKKVKSIRHSVAGNKESGAQNRTPDSKIKFVMIFQPLNQAYQ